MNAFSDELRLALVVLLNGGVFATAYRLARRLGPGGAGQAVCDAFLLYFLVQYVAVALPGVFGVFGTATMAMVAFTAAAGMWVAAGRGARARPGRREGPSVEALPGRSLPSDASEYWNADRLGLLGCTLFATGYLGTYAWTQAPLPPFATDALVYHLPTAVDWIQTHRLGVYPTWYWNPAASYSPGTGSIFLTWWMAPAGNDVFVRFAQLPPLVFLFFLVVRMCEMTGCSRTVAGLIGIAAVLSRPLFSEAIFPKDDLYVTSFVVAVVLSLSGERARDRLGPSRAGVAIGFVLASKYTVLLACPVLLFLVDSPFRARWRPRHWALAAGVAGAMALPWYVRNVVLSGNPLYPVDVHLPPFWLRGLFGTERDQQLRTGGGVWKMLAGTYHSLPAPLIVLLAGGWAWAWSARRSVVRDALPRAAVIGSAVTLCLFLASSPHHEVRYIFPLIVLWYVACGLGIGRGLRQPAARIGAAAIFAIASTATTFNTQLLGTIAFLSGVSLLISALGVSAVVLQARFLRLRRNHLAMLASGGGALLAILAYVHWHAYIEDYRQSRFVGWGLFFLYPHQAPLWKWVDENLPADATIAYANTFFVYPYYGFNFTRRLGYAPTRRGLHDFLQFPRMGDRVPGDLLVRRMTEMMDGDPDRATWRENLSTMEAGYLVVMKHDPQSPDLDHDPPELKLAGEEPNVFLPIYEDEAGVVFRIGGK